MDKVEKKSYIKMINYINIKAMMGKSCLRFPSAQGMDVLKKKSFTNLQMNKLML